MYTHSIYDSIKFRWYFWKVFREKLAEAVPLCSHCFGRLSREIGSFSSERDYYVVIATKINGDEKNSVPLMWMWTTT